MKMKAAFVRVAVGSGSIYGPHRFCYTTSLRLMFLTLGAWGMASNCSAEQILTFSDIIPRMTNGCRQNLSASIAECAPI